MIVQHGSKRQFFIASSYSNCVIAMVVVTLTSFAVSVNGQESNDVPSWMSGKSTWTGSGYQVESAPAIDLMPQNVDPSHQPKLNPYVANNTTPYTVPFDPQAIQPGVAQAVETTTNDFSELANAGLPWADAVIAQADNATAPATDVIAQVAHQQTLAGPVIGGAPLINPPGIAQQIGTGMTMEQPPLIEESIRWYQYPWRWMTEGWTNSVELGLDGSKGNAETLAIQTGAELKRKTDAYTLALDFDYRLVNNRDVVTEDNGRFNIDYDRLLGDSPWSLFSKFGLEWDEFKAFDLRLNLNGGIGYHWIRNDRTTFVTRFGAGASREIGAPDDDWVPEAVFGFDAEHQLNKRNKLKAKVDYFPSWENFSDFRLVSDASWEILLNDDDSLSLKLAVTDRYDSTPQGGNKENDLYYSLLLLVKF